MHGSLFFFFACNKILTRRTKRHFRSHLWFPSLPLLPNDPMHLFFFLQYDRMDLLSFFFAWSSFGISLANLLFLFFVLFSFRLLFFSVRKFQVHFIWILVWIRKLSLLFRTEWCLGLTIRKLLSTQATLGMLIRLWWVEIAVSCERQHGTLHTVHNSTQHTQWTTHQCTTHQHTIIHNSTQHTKCLLTPNFWTLSPQ